MSHLLPYLKVVFLFTLTGLSLFRLAPKAVREVHSWVDKVLLASLTGIAFYTIFFLLAQGLFSLPLNAKTVWSVFAGVVILGSLFEILRRRRNRLKPDLKNSHPNHSHSWGKETFTLLVLSILFLFSLNVRLVNGLRYPDKLLDADPYRHHIRTEALVDTQYLNKFDPYIVGEVPIFELQGCYILTGVLAVTGPFAPWKLWLWGSQVFGALSILSLYLLVKLGLQKILRRDLGQEASDKISKNHLSPEWVGSCLGLIAAAFLAASPVHILRTNAGFSEAYAIPLLAPTLLFYLWAAQSRLWSDFIGFGVFFSALALINPVPAVFIVPFFLVHALYLAVRDGGKRWILGNLLAGAIFFFCLIVWNWKFLATPLFTGAEATSQAGTEGILKSLGENITWLQKLAAGWERFNKELYRNLGFLNFSGKYSRPLLSLGGLISKNIQAFYDFLVLLAAGIGSLWILRDPKKRTWDFNATTTFFFFSFTVFFVVLFLIPFGFISFTSKYYRYLLPISFSLSYLCAYFLWRIVLSLFSQAKGQNISLVLLTCLTLIVAKEGRPWGGWELNCTPEEYQAAAWIQKNTSPQDFIIANWYTGDYIRSLSKRNIIISDYPRIEVKVAQEKFNLKIPILPRDPKAVLEYIREHPGTYYLLVSKWGPWGKYESNPAFRLEKVFGAKSKSQAKIFSIDPNRAQAQENPSPNTSSETSPHPLPTATPEKSSPTPFAEE